MLEEIRSRLPRLLQEPRPLHFVTLPNMVKRWKSYHSSCLSYPRVQPDVLFKINSYCLYFNL